MSGDGPTGHTPRGWYGQHPYVLARESDQDGWDEYVALRQAVLERNEALIDGD